MRDLDALDRADPLRGFRERFTVPKDIVYLDGNSLGGLPRATAARVADVVEREWGEGLIRSWNQAGWIDLPRRVGDKIARLIGARAGEVIVADSTSVNLFKALSGALGLRPDRRVVLTEADNFPTDLYIAEGVAALLGAELRRVAGDAIEDAVDDRVRESPHDVRRRAGQAAERVAIEIDDVLGDREALAKAAERISAVERVEVTHGE